MNKYQVLSLERPKGLVGTPGWVEDMTYLLPNKAQEKGMIMLDIIYEQPGDSRDPVIIFDREGRILHTWPDGYSPGFLEVEKVCKELLGRKQ